RVWKPCTGWRITDWKRRPSPARNLWRCSKNRRHNTKRKSGRLSVWTASRLKLQFQSNGMYRAYARIHPNGTKVPTCETSVPSGIKTEIHAPGFYEYCGTPQYSILCALRREDFFDKLKRPAVSCRALFSPLPQVRKFSIGD